MTSNQINRNFIKDQEYFDFLDFLNVFGVYLGIKNLELNVTAADLEKIQKNILEEIHGHLAEQDRHLSAQDKHLMEQDRHLMEQDMRLDMLEELYFGRGHNE